MNIMKLSNTYLEKLHPMIIMVMSYMMILLISRNHGIIISLLSVAGWLIADYLSREFSQELVPLWTAVMHLGFYFIAVFLLAIIRKTLDRELNLAMNDFLTGIANSRSFFEKAEQELKRARRYNRHLMLAYMDLDNFKSVNDIHGHMEGDNLLKVVAATLRENIREYDVVARLGGDEFVILIPELTPDHSILIIEKILARLLDEMEKHGWPVTFSVGAVYFRSLPGSVKTMIKAADTLMYESKKSGKNMIKVKEYESQAPAQGE